MIEHGRQALLTELRAGLLTVASDSCQTWTPPSAYPVS